MLVYGLISPHPPIILPEVGGDELVKVRKTIEALDAAVASLAAARPEALIVISPHEDHGYEVPEYYLRKALPGDLPVEEILVTEDSYQYYYDLGKDVGERLRHEPKRYAVVASGDLSHVLKVGGPYGFNAAGPRLDKAVVAAVRRGDAQALLDIDPATLEDGAECGLRSVLFLLGALDGMDVRPKVLSYEGPFGVGYLVATFEVKGVGGISITDLARESIKAMLERGEMMKAPEPLPKKWDRRAGAFVSLHAGGELRGCIGTIAPTKDSLAEEVIANAVAAATQDPRFSAVHPGEVDDLDISVDVLGQPVLEPDITKLDPKKFGVIVEATDGRRGVLLPDLDGVTTAKQQIRICREKGGIGPKEPVEISKFEVERFSE